LAEKKQYKLDMFGTVLPAIDKRMRGYYGNLTEDERKGYSAYVLMKAMSSLGDQSPYKEYQLLAVNDLVNIGFSDLSKNHVELLHMLLCATGLGTKQYHPWLQSASKGKDTGKTPLVDEFLMELYPFCNDAELDLLKSQHDRDSIKSLAMDAGKSDQEVKALSDDAKKL
jgi:hypothetical protein